VRRLQLEVETLRNEAAVLRERLAALESRTVDLEALRHAATADFAARTNPRWFEPIATEPSVQVHMRDLVKPQHIAFDVGANLGQLTEILSDLVGPRGSVVAFEANPGSLPLITANIVKNARRNVTLSYAAVMQRSGLWFGLVDHGAASVVVEAGDSAFVPSLALDDFAAKHNMWPDFIKLDIEGNEIFALEGAAKIIEKRRPNIIFEHNVGDDRALLALRAAGYETFCSSQHTPISTSADCLAGSTLRNIVAIHRSRIGATRFARTPGRSRVVTIEGHELSALEPKDAGCSVLFGQTRKLPAGRYLFTLSASADANTTLFFRISGRGFVQQNWTLARHFLSNDRDIAVELTQDTEVGFEVGEIAVGQSLKIASVGIEQIAF
jgi:FkbM family methyltransferase